MKIYFIKQDQNDLSNEFSGQRNFSQMSCTCFGNENHQYIRDRKSNLLAFIYNYRNLLLKARAL